MPVLSNSRHERFCQELAKGKSQTEAYLTAGYDASEETARRAASKLMTNHDIADRLAELQGRAAAKAELTAQTVITNLTRIAEKAEVLGEASGLNVAKGAWMDAAKVSGLIVEKKELGRPGDFKRMSEDELDAYIASGQGAFGRSDSGKAAPDSQAGVRTKPSGIH